MNFQNLNFTDPKFLTAGGLTLLLIALVLFGGALLPLAIILVPIIIVYSASQLFKKQD